MFNAFLEKQFYGNDVYAYLYALIGLIVGIFVIKIVFSGIIVHRLKKLSLKTHNTIDDFFVHIIERMVTPLLIFGALYASVNSLTLSLYIQKGIKIASLIVLTIYIIRFVVALLVYIIETYAIGSEKNEARERSLKGILTVIKVIIWGIGIMFISDNLGFKISAVIAGLGIGGVAVALAAQAILGDLFSYFAIFFDRPFEVGDFIIVNEYLGVIEHIGIKTTRIRSLSGEQLIFSNTDLTNSRVRNYKRMEKRRVLFKLGVTYQTSLEKMKKIPGIIENIIKKVDDTVFDRAHFSAYGDFNLAIEVVYYVMGSDYNKYMDIQQKINFEIKESFEKEGIEFAYPTQTLFVNKEN